MTDRGKRPSGFVAWCRCGTPVACVNHEGMNPDDVRTMLCRWLWDGFEVEPKFGSWVVSINACQCEKEGEQ